MAILLRYPAPVWGLLLVVMAHCAVARVLTEDHVPVSCGSKHKYTCEDDGATFTCGNTPNSGDPNPCVTEGATFCRLDAAALPVGGGTMMCGGQEVKVTVDRTGGPVQLTLQSDKGTFADFVDAKGGPGYCQLQVDYTLYQGEIKIKLPTQVTPVKTYKDFSNLAFCFLPCPCNTCGMKQEFVCESYLSTVPGAGTAEQKAYAAADCGQGCRPKLESAQYGRVGSTGTISLVNGIDVNSICTCRNAQYCTDSTLCTTSDCNMGTCAGWPVDVKTEIQYAIDNCQENPNPCGSPIDVSTGVLGPYECTVAWCPSGRSGGVYNFWANNYLKQNLHPGERPPGDPCQGTYKYMLFSWRCEQIA